MVQSPRNVKQEIITILHCNESNRKSVLYIIRFQNCRMLDLKPKIKRLRIESKYDKRNYKQDFWDILTHPAKFADQTNMRFFAIEDCLWKLDESNIDDDDQSKYNKTDNRRKTLVSICMKTSVAI